ncbi:MAG: homoserine O-succinyltransferase [Oscillospiraceae bacterium]|jgi:homoserine O-succinyltransferase|nr:homoserine O-succinyltransferase [Oscillospiraceae bacterium]
MPINIDAALPAREILENENIFVMSQERATSQDIRPLRIAILNLMPTKIETETQLLRLLSNSPIQVDIDLLHVASHVSKNTSQEHLLEFYKTFDEVRRNHYDGMIITGAPVETMAFEDVDYWEELQELFAWSRHHVYSTLHICWGAQAGLYYHYGIQKHPLPKKLSGIYAHELLLPTHALLRGFDDRFYAPHSRYTTVLREDIDNEPGLNLLTFSPLAGVHIVCDTSNRNVYVTGHSEYDRNTLANEYARDIAKGIDPQVPVGYFPNDDPAKTPVMNWRGCASLLFLNWMNYFVYQQTPFDLSIL